MFYLGYSLVLLLLFYSFRKDENTKERVAAGGEINAREEWRGNVSCLPFSFFIIHLSILLPFSFSSFLFSFFP